jgi:hypothetical protein
MRVDILVGSLRVILLLFPLNLIYLTYVHVCIVSHVAVIQLFQVHWQSINIKQNNTKADLTCALHSPQNKTFLIYKSATNVLKKNTSNIQKFQYAINSKQRHNKRSH